jgi:hypothetical protein
MGRHAQVEHKNIRLQCLTARQRVIPTDNLVNNVERDLHVDDTQADIHSSSMRITDALLRDPKQALGD